LSSLNEETDKRKKPPKKDKIVVDAKPNINNNIIEKKVGDVIICSQDMITMVSKMMQVMKDFGCQISDKKFL
jgi:hypothetical protein